MILTEFDAEKYERTLRSEGREEERGLINKLISALLAQDRIDDLRRAAKDSEYQEQLIKELGL